MARIALFGGNFDPPTVGHALVIRGVLDAHLADEVWVVPVGDDRYDRRLTAAGVHRRRMVEILLAAEFPTDPVRLEPIQLEGGSPGSATIDLVRALRIRHPADEFLFIIGSDNLPAVVGWREAPELLRTISFLVVPRPGHPIPAALPARIRVVPVATPSPASSTDVRRRRAVGDAAADMLTAEVAAYAAEHGLYETPPVR